MVNSPINRHQQLAEWIYTLVEILRVQNNSTWRTLVTTVSGKTAIIHLDGFQLQLQASATEPLQLQINYPIESDTFNFRSDAETLRDIIAGGLTLNKALATSKIYLRGTLQDLQRINTLLLEIISDSPINGQLQRLWEEFDENWPRSSPSCYSLEEQQIIYGELITIVPEDVLNIEVESD